MRFIGDPLIFQYITLVQKVLTDYEDYKIVEICQDKPDWMLPVSCPAFRGIMGRGIERRKIFLKDRDRKNFLGRLSAMA